MLLRSKYLLLIFCFTSILIAAQTSSFLLKPERALELSKAASSGSLAVVIDNEKYAYDGALVSAVKNYWKASSYRFMSRTEFYEGVKAGKLPKTNLYLYENEYGSGNFILTNSPSNETFFTKKDKSLANLEYSILNSGFDFKGKILDGYFDLMVKHFNFEIKYCGNESNFTKDNKKKASKSNIVFYVGDESFLKDKSILLVKEQALATDRSKKKRKKNKIAKYAFLSNQYKISEKNVYTVFPEDVKYALKKNDKQVLLLNDGLLYSAEDGAIVASPVIKQDVIDLPFILGSLGVLVLGLGTAYLIGY